MKTSGKRELLKHEWGVEELPVARVAQGADSDVVSGFAEPPPGYGQVPFYWWIGDPLTRERLAWQLDQLAQCGKGISGLQINYAHGYRNGGISYGLTIPSAPPLFSEDWWNLVSWFMEQAKRRGWAISLSDYTLGPGQGWCFDALLREYPEMSGAELAHLDCEFEAGSVDLNLPPEPLTVVAWPLNGSIATAPIDLRKHVAGEKLRWHSPVACRIIAVGVKRVALSYDPMHPESGRRYADLFFGQFERRFPGETGRGLNFFFSDELNFNLKGYLWNDLFADEFQRRKGYDIVPELPALFVDCGPRSPKIRLDYNDVLVALSEEGFFKPVFDWHQQRGMTHGCDHSGRGRRVLEFGDYFRTQRWNQGPGCDQSHLGADLIKNKVASSIAHLYERPRVWLEGFYASGWGTGTEDLTQAVFANFAQGHNLLSLHGLYYTTHGGYWEWAPPCNHFRMPYWPHMKTFLDLVQRLSYLLSQGVHCCDVAILYPVAPTAAMMGGPESVEAAFDAGRALYARTIDFDFMDFESLARAEIVDRELRVSGERYRVLVLPAMRAVRWSTIEKALAFHRAGGLVLALGSLPVASDRVGGGDPELDSAVAEIFGRPGAVVQSADQLADTVANAFLPDISVLSANPGAANFIHRKIGARDLYMIHGLPTGTEVRLRAMGAVELWDTWAGNAQPLPIHEQTSEFTRLRLPRSEHEAQLIVFTPGSPQFESQIAPAPRSKTIELDGAWEFELRPTLDNRFGDFHWPPTPELIGPEIRRLDYREGEAPSAAWHNVSVTYGPQFIRCRDMPDSTTDPTPPTTGERVEFSWRWGIEHDPGRQGYHGLKGLVHDDTFAIGRAVPGPWETTYTAEEQDTILWTTVRATKPMHAFVHTGHIRPVEAWLNGQLLTDDTVHLNPGANPLILRYDRNQPGRTYFTISTTPPVAPGPEHVVYPPGEQPPFPQCPMASKWHGDRGRLPFDIRPGEACPVGWYRFTAPPGLGALTVDAQGEATVQVNGQNVPATDEGVYRLAAPVVKPCEVMIRVRQQPGFYGGAAFKTPIRLDCGIGEFQLGDWSINEGLACYSGGAWYRRTVELPPAARVLLDLGNLSASAEVRVNGEFAGTRIAPPWAFDISRQARVGVNRLEILVYNTLANHYQTIPTNYRGDTTSGLLGPVRIELERTHRKT